jgi:hypothetical protein
MSPQQSVTHLLHQWKVSKRQAEEAGLTYTEDFTVDLLLDIINKANKQKYSVNANIYMDKRGHEKQIDFTTMEYAYPNIDKNRI